MQLCYSEMAMKPADYLKQPYGRVVIRETDGTYRAEIIEFPGCIAVGDTAGEALANLERVADSWLQATIAKWLRVPEPIESTEYEDGASMTDDRNFSWPDRKPTDRGR
jgi:antitoxin HicB